ncbi:hypothetical protein KAT92_03570 [Candidatus Babeliales bacterium]|nr:hypothetical protein [Candidatus Babeliales bacterium]
MKKQITLAIMLALGSGMATNRLAGMEYDGTKWKWPDRQPLEESVDSESFSKKSCLVAMGAEALSGVAHAYRLGKTMTSKSAKEIKIVSAIAAFTNLATLLAHGYKTSSYYKNRGLSAACDVEAIGRHLFEAFNAIRMYRNAENIASTNKLNPQSLLKAKAILLSSLLANRGLRMTFDANFADLFKLSKNIVSNDEDDYNNKTTYQQAIGFLLGAPLLATTLHQSIYEHGLYDGLKKANKVKASQNDVDDEDIDEDDDE